MLTNTYSPAMDATYLALSANGITYGTGSTPISLPTEGKTYLEGLRTFILQQLAARDTVFAITNNSGNNFTSALTNVLLGGTAQFDVHSIWLNSVQTNASTWPTGTNWAISVTLTNGANTFSVDAWGGV